MASIVTAVMMAGASTLAGAATIAFLVSSGDAAANQDVARAMRWPLALISVGLFAGLLIASAVTP